MREKTRLTVDMTPDEHMYLKMACVKIGVSMKDFLLQLAFEKIEDMEDEWLANKATETLKNIKSGKEKLISWEEAKKRLST